MSLTPEQEAAKAAWRKRAAESFYVKKPKKSGEPNAPAAKAYAFKSKGKKA